MMRRTAAAVGLGAVSVIGSRVLARRMAARLLDAPRTTEDEAALGPALDALGGEVVRFRARDGVRLAGRWLPAEPRPGEWVADPHEAILLLHGYTGSIAPDLVEHGPWLRRTAGVLGLDFRGHGASGDGQTTFGLLETEDVAGALAWLGERGVARVALVGSSMGGITAIASVAVLGDGSLPGADVDVDAPRHVVPAPRPRVVAVVGDSVAAELETPVAARLRGPGRRFLAARLFDAVARAVGGDPRAIAPARVIGLTAPVPVLLIQGEADRTVPVGDAHRLAALAGSGARLLVIPGADHGGAHATDPTRYEAAVTAFLQAAFGAARQEHLATAPL